MKKYLKHKNKETRPTYQETAENPKHRPQTFWAFIYQAMYKYIIRSPGVFMKIK